MGWRMDDFFSLFFSEGGTAYEAEPTRMPGDIVPRPARACHGRAVGNLAYRKTFAEIASFEAEASVRTGTSSFLQGSSNQNLYF